MQRVLTALIALAFVACSLGSGQMHPDLQPEPAPDDAEITVQMDVTRFGSGNIYIVDGRNGTVLERFHNVSNGVDTREIEYRDVKDRQISVVWDSHGERPYVLGMPEAQEVVFVEGPNDIICIQIKNLLRSSNVGMNYCA